METQGMEKHQWEDIWKYLKFISSFISQIPVDCVPFFFMENKQNINKRVCVTSLGKKTNYYDTKVC